MPDILINRDVDETPPAASARAYAQEPERVTRRGDFETEEIELLRTETKILRAELARAIELKDGESYDWDLLARVNQLDAARVEYRRVYARMPQFAKNWLQPLGLILEATE